VLERQLLLIVHILLLVAWLGVDVGVFTSSFFIRRRELPGLARVELRRVMRSLDLAPRVSVVLTIPVALGLAQAAGFASVPAWILLAVATVAVLWAGGLVWLFARTDTLGHPRFDDARAAGAFAKVDLGLRLAALGFFAATGVHSLVSPDGLWQATFLSWKALLFAVTIAAGVRIRYAARPFGVALREIVERGESEAALQRMDGAMAGVYPMVLTIWGSLVMMTVLAVVRPA
jgi:hypothetical protein